MGQFSWFTQDSHKQIGNMPECYVDVTMYDDKGNSWSETEYEGYGVFGGKDYFDLVAEMNGYDESNWKTFKPKKGWGSNGGLDNLRDVGIAIGAQYEDGHVKKGTYKFPALYEGPFNPNHDFYSIAPHDPDQGWCYEDEDYAKGGITDDDFPSDDQEKLAAEHIKEAKKEKAKITNMGWGSGPDYIESKTDKGILYSDIEDGKVSHEWEYDEEEYAKGGQTYKRGQFIYTDPESDRHEQERIKQVKKGIEKRFKKGEISKTKKDELFSHLDSRHKSGRKGTYAKGGKLSDFPKEIKLQDLLKWYTGTAYWYNTNDLTAHDNITVDGKFQSETDMDINDWLKIYRSKKVKVYIEESPNQNYDYTFELRGHKFQLWDAISIYPQVKYKLGGAIEDTNQWNTIAEIHGEVEEFVEGQIDHALNVALENLYDLNNEDMQDFLQDYPNIETHFFNGDYEIKENKQSLFRDRKFQRLVEDLAKQYAKHIEIYKKDGKDD